MSLSNPLQHPDIIEAQATYYPHMVSVYIPSSPIIRTSNKNSVNQAYDAWVGNGSAEKETSPERSLRHTKKQVSNYVLCNNFELWATFTFANNRQDEGKLRQQMKDWLKNQKRLHGKFSYLIVLEYQTDGTLHYHALLKNYTGSIKKAISPNTGRQIIKGGKPCYNLAGFTHGFTEVRYITQRKEDKSRLASYITKYLTKELLTLKNKKRYWNSKDLISPKVEDNPEKWYELVKPDWKIETENGRVMRFFSGTHPLIDVFIKENSP